MPVYNLPQLCVSKLHDVRVHLWQLTESQEELVKKIPDASVVDRLPFSAFKSERRKLEWLGVRALLHAVCQTPVEIMYDVNGRPSLDPKIAEFSISHTYGIASIALSSQPVGIDVEQMSGRAYRVRDHFLTPEEMDFDHVADAELMATWMWSAKESVYKLYGQPETELKADLSLRLRTQLDGYAEFDAQSSRSPLRSWVRCFALDGFVLTVATFI